MHRNWMKVSSGTLVAVAVGTVIWVNAGSLTPAPGPVAPTMKTLQQVEPRTPVETLAGDGSNLYIITQPGSYYLTGNINGTSGKNGIQIDADNVTLDLRGFTLQGMGGAGSGIWVNNRQNIAIRNGSIAGWSNGLDAAAAHNSLIEGIRASSNQIDGIRAWYGCAIRDCVAESNQNRGFAVWNSCKLQRCAAVYNGSDGFDIAYTCALTDCSAESNGGRGFAAVYPGEFAFLTDHCTFLNCTAAYNSRDGFTFGAATTFNNCSAQDNGGRGFAGELDETGEFLASGCAFVNCAASRNRRDGFRIGDGNSFGNCSSIYNGVSPAVTQGSTSSQPSDTPSAAAADISGGNGIYCGYNNTVTGCTLVSNQISGIDGTRNVTISDSTVGNNNNMGVWIGSGTVSNCTINDNGYDGVHAEGGAITVTHSTVTGNGNNGILLRDGGRVEGCTVANNSSGIVVDPASKGCQIVRNNVRQHYGDGILVTSDCVVADNHSEENGNLVVGGNAAGIKATGQLNRIEGNHVIRNDRGIEVTATANTIFRNSARGNTDNYGSIIVGNDRGPIGTAASATSPWANLAF